MNRLRKILYYLQDSPMLAVGTGMILILVLFGTLGPLVIDTSAAQPLSTVPRQAPSWDHPFEIGRASCRERV